MRTTTAAVHSHSPKRPGSLNHPPSVPLYVYRELAAELEATQAKLDALTAKNQQLEQENQCLRQEITKVWQSISHLQKLVDFRSNDSVHPPRTTNEAKNTAKPPKNEPRQRPQSPRHRQPEAPKAKAKRLPNFSIPFVEINSHTPETVFIEEQAVSYYPPMEAEKKEFSGWWLVITIVLVMLTAFGAGYLIVRPLFAHQSR